MMNTQHYPFTLIPLAYAYDALEPYIDATTMQLHHDRHLQTYIDNLNATLADYPAYHAWNLERLLQNINWLPEAIRTPVKRNAGGVYNHNLFFAGLTPTPDTQPSEPLAQAFSQTFGHGDAFKETLKTQALSVFGSGYAWLVSDAAGTPRILTTPNQDTPLALDVVALMLIDVWEHAYYLHYYNKRADYIDGWFHVADFVAASRRYEEILHNSPSQ